MRAVDVRAGGACDVRTGAHNLCVVDRTLRVTGLEHADQMRDSHPPTAGDAGVSAGVGPASREWRGAEDGGSERVSTLRAEELEPFSTRETTTRDPGGPAASSRTSETERECTDTRSIERSVVPTEMPASWHGPPSWMDVIVCSPLAMRPTTHPIPTRRASSRA
eukprot:CAMPEP_0180162894 /NCGR_PEP_ID=MMETSP0986-20121125/29484_1 /TAXON_ID=697907 /ORGANISM="non described non described, Strain CCMP2293" /LENGTH=163 /DNA_ID=CAMNT_0022113443 /DNA_START=194 /DNA_END=682 /DNA_ORIENTATION=+